jgi:hypothetical protein
MNDVFCRQPSATGDHSPPSRQASNLANDSPAISQYRWSTGCMNGTIHSPSAQKR